MTDIDVERGKTTSHRELKQAAAWVEDESQEIRLNSSSSSSNNEHESIEQSKIEPKNNSAHGYSSPSQVSTKEYPQVVVKETVDVEQREVDLIPTQVTPRRYGTKIKSSQNASASGSTTTSPLKTPLEKLTRIPDKKSHQVTKNDQGMERLSLNSRRMSAGDSSLDGRSITSQSYSETRSYRDKLKDRFQSVKERAGNITSETKSRKLMMDSISQQTAKQSRADELLKKEEMELEAALEKHQNTYKKKQMDGISGQQISSADMSMDFFAKVWDPEPEVVGSPVALVSQEEDEASRSSSGPCAEDQVDVTGGRDHTKLLAADYLGFSRDEWELVDHSVGPILDGKDKSCVKESELYFYPSAAPVSLEDRLGSGKEVRFREEEGLFVGHRPKVRTSNIHRLEKRLLEQGGRHWFGDDGELNTMPDPLRSAPYRPPSRSQGAKCLQVEYIPGAKHLVYESNLASEGASCALLEIHIGTLSFHHHPLFNQEHVLSQRLSDLYNQYSVREVMQQEERLAGRLDSLRQAYDNLQLLLNSNAADITSQQLDRMQSYKKEIRATWQHLLLEGFRSRQLLLSLLSCWRDLRKLRDTQGFTCTPLRLVIHREQLPHNEMLAEKIKWENEIRQACIEMEMEEQERFSHEWEVYQSQLEVWKKQQIMRGKVSDVRQETVANEMEEGAEEQTNSDVTSQIITNSRAVISVEEPVEPKPFDGSKIRAEVVDKMTLCLRPPGEPKLKFALKETESIENSPNDIGEKQRRKALRKCQLFVRVFYNNKEVCKTHAHPLGSNFKIVFNECFSIRISQPPDSIHLSVIEDGAGSGRHHLAQIYLPIPSANKTLKSAAMENHEFSSDRIVSFSHTGVGSGTFISGSPVVNGCLYTSGVISSRSGWGIDQETKLILAPQQKYLPSNDSEQVSSNILSELGKDGTLDLTKLTEWAKKSQLDPNDPSNASFFFLVKNLNANCKRDSVCFRLDSLLREFDFCDSRSLDNNPRLKMLTLRAQGESEFREYKLVPNREKEIPLEIFKTYEKRLNVSARESEFEIEMTWSDPLSSHRAWGRLYLERVYQRVLAQCKQAQRTASLHHIIAEDQVPDISTLGLTFMKWLQPKRPLRPLRKERKKVAVQSLAGQDVKLMVNVIRAFEVPVRKTTDSLLGSMSVPSSSNLGFVTVAVRPFVEISFQGSTLRTTTAEGANPTWNQDLQVPVRPGSSDSDTLFIHLFDEVIVDLVDDDRQRETSIHQRLERNWLASLHIPFTTLVHNARIEGTFKMYSPPMLLGYERESHQRSGWQSGNFSPDQGQLFPNRDATFINLFITVQPALNPPELFNERLNSSEVSALEEHLIHFEREMDVLLPHRKIKTLVIDASGKSVCVTRFFRPLSPPATSSETVITEDTAARFVSMVPMAPNQGMLDVWLTCDQILRLGWGDSWAHAVLLCCYFLGLGKKAWMLIGTGIPHGMTAYVLVREKQEQDKVHYWVWDPTAGQRYSIFDSFCPLQRICGLINDENIWINLQKEELPRRTQFNLDRRSDWMAAFGRRGAITAPVGSVQPASLHYSPTSFNAATTLQDKLEKFLRDSLMKWRRTKVTLWNRYCIATLRKILPRLEQASCFGSGDNASPHHTRELQHILASHKVCGFPINLPYKSVEAIVEAVRATGVHHNQDENAEFALAVYVHTFPNNILSVWVYVASLTKLR
ncbi:coiled-coil and C2 domain-containing protein 2A [Frankliniella occidentalis]|uniref:Coiled-coil and C2 domain-containing protein 2A n=1 Tax=Frankliniella occidentalis TaxID=133901 RepID=A0A6J1SFU1_FRAOC|nr:coiled-coil and C2 domain-containing protein 2A [Frankliniella occidentalis]